MADTADAPGFGPQLEAELAALERDMPTLQSRNPGAFALANAWALRYDAILQGTPAAQRPEMEARLKRIGIRWCVMPGTRMTAPFPAMPKFPKARTGSGD